MEKIRLSITFPVFLADRIHKVAAARMCSFAAAVRYLLNEALKRELKG